MLLQESSIAKVCDVRVHDGRAHTSLTFLETRNTSGGPFGGEPSVAWAASRFRCHGSDGRSTPRHSRRWWIIKRMKGHNTPSLIERAIRLGMNCWTPYERF